VGLIVVAGVLIVVVGLFGPTVVYSKSISNVQAAQSEVTKVVEKKVDTVHNSLEKTQVVGADPLSAVAQRPVSVPEADWLKGVPQATRPSGATQVDPFVGVRLPHPQANPPLEVPQAILTDAELVRRQIDEVIYSGGTASEVMIFIKEMYEARGSEAPSPGRLAAIEKAIATLIGEKKKD
jgi:hypothetical protein